MFSLDTLAAAVADYEKNLANFDSGRVVPRRGEVASNKRALAHYQELLRKRELELLTTESTQ